VFALIADSPEFRQYCVSLNVNPGRVLDPGKPMVALTYDDGPRSVTSRVVDVFERHNSVATFYVNGYLVGSDSGTISRAFKLGFEYGNHGWTHQDMTTMSYGSLFTSMLDTGNAVQSITGLWPRTMRPTYGHINSTVVSVSADLGLPVLLWSIDSGDGSGYYNPATVANHVINNARHGSIVLLHEHSSNAEHAANIMVPELINRGFQLVTISELLFYTNNFLGPGQIFG